MVRRILLAAGIAVVLVGAGIAGTVAFATTVNLAHPNAAASPSPSQGPGSFKSNEATTHETGETAAQEAAENSGQGRGQGGPRTCSNEVSAHEASEPAAREAAEPKGQCPAPTGSPASTTTQ